MATEIVMPNQGQSVEACTIVAWRKQPGDHVATGEVICEIETDKATFEVESPEDGTLLAHYAAEGDEVPVLTPIASVGEAGEAASPTAGANPPASQQTETVASAVAASAAAACVAAAPASPTEPRPPGAAPSGNGPLAISPRARRAARQMSVDVAAISGSGPRGRIVERDVLAASNRTTAVTAGSAAGSNGPLGSSGPPASGERTPIRGVRKLIAERMHASLRDTAQLTLNAFADAENMVALRAALKQRAARAAPDTPQAALAGITLNDLMMYAVSRTLPAFTEVNAITETEEGGAGWIERFAEVHLGFAVDTDVGLMVPVLRDAHELALLALSRQAAALADAARSRRIAADQLQGGTFTVSNLGVFGIESFTPVLNTPQVAILGVGAIAPKPVYADGEVIHRRHIGLSLTIDHRVVDGAPAARFMQALTESIADIDLLLAI